MAVRFRVEVTPEAESDLRRAYGYLRDHSLPAARDWSKGIRARIRTLATNPLRCPLAPEAVTIGEPIRELFFGSGNRGTYRILFVVEADWVFVVHVRHGSRLALGAEVRED